MDSYGTLLHDGLSESFNTPKKNTWKSAFLPAIISLLFGVVVLAMMANRNKTHIIPSVQTLDAEQVPFGGIIVTLTKKITLITVYLPMQAQKNIEVKEGLSYFTSRAKTVEEISAKVNRSLVPPLKKAKKLAEGPPFATIKHTGDVWSKLTKVQKAGIIQGVTEALSKAGFKYMPQWFVFDAKNATTSQRPEDAVRNDKKALETIEKAKKTLERHLRETEKELKEELEKEEKKEKEVDEEKLDQTKKEQKHNYKEKLKTLKAKKAEGYDDLLKREKEQKHNLTSQWADKIKEASVNDTLRRKKIKKQMDELRKEEEGLKDDEEKEEKVEENAEKKNKDVKKHLQHEEKEDFDAVRTANHKEMAALKQKHGLERANFWMEDQTWGELDWSEIETKWKQLLKQQQKECEQLQEEQKVNKKNVTTTWAQKWTTEKEQEKTGLEPFKNKIDQIKAHLKELKEQEEKMKEKMKDTEKRWVEKKAKEAEKLQSKKFKKDENQEKEEGKREEKALEDGLEVALKDAKNTYKKQRQELLKAFKTKLDAALKAAEEKTSLPQIDKELSEAKEKLKDDDAEEKEKKGKKH